MNIAGKGKPPTRPPVSGESSTMPPTPTVYRGEDGRCTIKWNTPDGNMPSQPILYDPQFVVEVVGQINEAIELRQKVGRMTPVVAAAVAWLEWPVTMRDELAEAVRTYLEDNE